MQLVGKNIFLRPLKAEDANGNYPNWLNDKEVCRYNSHGDTLYTKEMALSYIQSVQNNPTCKVFAICLKENNLHLGNISLQSISKKNQNAEFAILMGEKSFWGRGFSKEAAELLLAYGFNELKLHRIYCGTSEANVAMQRLALSLGMELEGRRKEAMYKNGEFLDVLEYGIINSDIYKFGAKSSNTMVEKQEVV
ncbi:MAG: GNAT family protein [Arcobacteraceae bacterium]|jgi:RimJ/RimL family protein N-acetyltransferase|nr:GNAT family protein [Arcobacteraceae bacterium]